MSSTAVTIVLGVAIGVFGLVRGGIRLVAERRLALEEERPMRRARVVPAAVQIVLAIALFVVVAVLAASTH